jgi:hypothetical protein
MDNHAYNAIKIEKAINAHAFKGFMKMMMLNVNVEK